MSVAQNIALVTQSHTALRVAMGIDTLRVPAARNPSISDDLWISLFTPKLKAALAIEACSTVLSNGKASHVFATEKRSTVLAAAAAQASWITGDHLELLRTNPGVNDQVVSALLNRQVPLTPAWLKDVGKRSADAHAVFLATDDATDDDVQAALGTWGASGRNKDVLPTLLSEHPNVIADAVRSPSSRVRMAAAGCRHLTFERLQRELAGLSDGAIVDVEEMAWIWVSLIANPACSLAVVRDLQPLLSRTLDPGKAYAADGRLARHPYQLQGRLEDETSERVLEWVARRTVPPYSQGQSDFGPVRYRLWDLPALLANPHLPEDIVIQLAKTISSEGALRHDLLLDSKMHAALASAQERWSEVFNEYAPALRELLASFVPEQARSPLDVTRPGSDESYWNDKIESVGPGTETWAGTATMLGDIRDGTIPFTNMLGVEARLNRAVAILDERVDDTTEAWMVVYNLAESFAGTTVELAQTANAIAAP